MVAAGLVLLGGVIAVLRGVGDAGPDQASPSTTSAALPTALKPYSADTVVLPQAGDHPDPPADLQVRSGPHRLVLTWGSALGHPNPKGAAGYQVDWGRRGGPLDQHRLLGAPGTQLDGLAEGVAYQVEVRSVDAFGQRSGPATAAGTPGGLPDTAGYALVDRFEHGPALDDTRWRFAARSGCAVAVPGSGPDHRGLAVSGGCGSDPAVLRSRAPFRLDTGSGDLLGALVVDTDAPGASGELLLDLAPGPVDLVAADQDGVRHDVEPATAREDLTVPPGGIRVRVAGTGTEPAVGTTVQVLTGPGTPRVPAVSDPPQPVPPAALGVTREWRVELHRDGVRVLCDGVLVARGDVVPGWTEATALVGFTAPAGARLHDAVDLVGFVGAPTSAPPGVTPPPMDVSTSLAHQDEPRQLLLGVTGGQLRVTVLPAQAAAPGAELPLVAKLLFGTVPLRPAAPGMRWLPGVAYPLVADLPPEALLLSGDRHVLALSVTGTGTPMGSAEFRVLEAQVELTPAAGASPTLPYQPERPVVGAAVPELAHPYPTLLDSAGQRVDAGRTLPRGRLVVDVVLDAAEGQRVSGELAGLAGYELWLDDKRVAAVPTTAEGPGTGGEWRIAVTTTGMSAGPHTVEVRAFGTVAGTRFTAGFATVLLQ